MFANHNNEIYQFILVPVLWLLLLPLLFLIVLRFMALRSLNPPASFLSLNYRLYSSSGFSTPPLPLLSSVRVSFFPPRLRLS